MRFVIDTARWFSARARKKRARMFIDSFEVGPNTRILDVGASDGSHIALVLSQTNHSPENVYIADIDIAAINNGVERYGFNPVYLDEEGGLPFPDQCFDIVHCSSVIEHVTVRKDKVWEYDSSSKFRAEAMRHQKQFARELMRVGKGYFVQTPYKYFLLESHSWLPFVGWLPRPLLLRVLRFTNRFWVKKTRPDWNLLTPRDLEMLFHEPRIIRERAFGLTKSIIAVGPRKTVGAIE